MNIIHIAGHLGADPEVRFTSSGQEVTVLRVAARVRRKSKDQGNKEQGNNRDSEDTIWWRVSVWGKNPILPHLKKGSAVMVVGEFHRKPEIFTNREGKPQLSMEITALHLMFSPFGRTSSESASRDSATYEGSNARGSETVAAPLEESAAFATGTGAASSNFLEDEIPF